MSNTFGVDLLQAAILERVRQYGELGYNEFHDAQHDGGELLAAATAMLLDAPGIWPWPETEMKLGLPKWRRMVVAIALIMAEADRMQFNGEIEKQ